MTDNDLEVLKRTVQARATWNLGDYYNICYNFLSFINSTQPTRIVSPFRQSRYYIFYQYGEEINNKITRLLNTNLFIESPFVFKEAFERLIAFLDELRLKQETAISSSRNQTYLASREIDKVVYTIQQATGCVGDTFENPNQTRKRIGQLFETLIKLLIQEVGIVCEPRTVNIPIPGYPGYNMSYELDVVFSRNKAILTSETEHK